LKRVLLVVDDDHDIAELFRVVMRKHFDEVLIAHNSGEAQRLVSQNEVTHLVCDLSIGPEEPLGSQLISRWRQARPSIGFAAVFTGAADRSSVEPAPDIDGVYIKPSGFDALVERLRSPESPSQVDGTPWTADGESHPGSEERAE
jgi:DNA-binding response OmpR family regulator